MRKRSEANYKIQKRQAIAFGKNPPYRNHPEADKMGLNAKGQLDKVLFGTCDTCDYFFAENIMPMPGMDVDGETHPCDHCKGTVTQIHLNIV